MSQLSSDGEISPEVHSIDLRLGNTCNQQCRMCGPYSSKKWIEDYIASLKEAQTDFDFERAKYENFNWQNDERLIDVSKLCGPKIMELHFGGGEPLYLKRMADILDLYIEMGLAQNIVLSFNTNLTVIPKSLLNRCLNFFSIATKNKSSYSI